ncbi:MAG: SEC-C domain-containing protein, partial [SAR324 cluster bacterium]|nr:SEC-C domain-containing protein [SAR324 cluster bacterium]
SAGEPSRAATWIAREIWNATPLESNGFKPQRLPAPKRNDPCPCGSGRKFKQCCAGMATGPVLDVEAMWLVLVDACSDKYWVERAAARVLPMEGIAAVAFRFRESGRWRRGGDGPRPQAPSLPFSACSEGSRDSERG